MNEITAIEAWEAVERLNVDITHNGKNKEWCASVHAPRFQLGWGATPLEAVGNLLARMGETAPSLSLGIRNGLEKVGELEQGRETVYADSERV